MICSTQGLRLLRKLPRIERIYNNIHTYIHFMFMYFSIVGMHIHMYTYAQYASVYMVDM